MRGDVKNEQDARALIQPYVEREDVLGAYLVGSATRPFRDALSDLDLEVVLTDEAYDATPDAERHVFVVDEGPPRRVDHELYLRAWSDFEGLADSRQDVVRQGYRHAVVLHDPHGHVAEVVRRVAELPAAVREERLRVHWLELLFGLGRAKKTLDRGLELDARLVLGDALLAAAKLLFVAGGAWPAPRHWTREELALLGVPDALLEGLEAAAVTTDLEAWNALLDGVRAHLVERDLAFHEDGPALVRWAFLTDAGRAAFERWA